MPLLKCPLNANSEPFSKIQTQVADNKLSGGGRCWETGAISLYALFRAQLCKHGRYPGCVSSHDGVLHFECSPVKGRLFSHLSACVYSDVTVHFTCCRSAIARAMRPLVVATASCASALDERMCLHVCETGAAP